MSGIDWLIDRSDDGIRANDLLDGQAVGDSFVNGVVQISQLSAMFVVVRPFVGRQWRRAGIVDDRRCWSSPNWSSRHSCRSTCSSRCRSAQRSVLPCSSRSVVRIDIRHSPASRQRSTDAGLPVTEVHPAKVDARGSTPYFATLDDGTGLFVKVLGGQERAADLLFRVYRFLRLKNVGDDRPFSSLRRTVEHEALVALDGPRHRRPDAAASRRGRRGQRLDAARLRDDRRVVARRGRRRRRAPTS